MFKATTLTIALLLCLHSYAQVEPIYSNYQHYTTEDGLPQNYVSSIVQDQDGFIWVATLDGIARFDGKNFIEFNITSDSSRKISTPRVLDLKVDKDNNLWILHFNHKVDRMNPQTFQIERDLKPILEASHDSFPLAMSYKASFYFTFGENLENNQWFVKNKLVFHLFDTTNHKLRKLFLEKKSEDSNRFAFDEDDQGRLWILGINDLEVSDANWENFKSIKFPDELHFELDPFHQLFLVTHISGGRILIFANERLIIYDEPLNQFREIKLPVARERKANHATVATRDPEGRVVFKYYGYVFRVNDDESISTLWKFPERDRFLISSILVARDGTLWAGVNTGGLYRINTLVPSFHSKKYEQNFVVDLLVNEMNIKPSEIPKNWFQNKGSYDFRYYYSEQGKLYFTQDGYYFGRRDGIFYMKGDQLRNVKTPGNSIYYKGFHDKDGFLSAIDNFGRHHHWEDISINPKVTECIDTGLPNNFQIINSTPANGFTWVTDSQNRIYQLDKGVVVKTHEVGDKNFGLIQLQPDLNNEGIFWIATYGGGLLKWDYRSNKVEKALTKNDGLTDNTIAAMVPDEDGNIWMSTFNGVSKFDPKSEHFTNYSTSDGLIQSEFDRHHGFKLPDGRIAFGGSQGYSVFDPSLFTEDQFNPEIKISRLLINNKEQLFGDSLSVVKEPLNQLEKLDLDYQSNTVSVEIMANQFNNPDKIHYRYKLTGYHKDWVNNNSDRKIQFDKLRTGTYLLSINASNTNGIWSEHVRKIQIQVLPPPWLSWWAYASYLLIGSLLIFLYWRNYRRKLILKQEEEFTRREAIRLKEVDDMKTRFFSNITHEFRTPLTLILSPLEKQLRDKKYPMEVQTILESNYRHGSHLLKLVNELLDISKLEGGFMQMHKSTGELNTFLKECMEDFSELAQQKGIDLTFDSKNISGYHQFDKNHLEKVVLNLLSNGIKFTDQNGKVGLSAEVEEDERLVIEVNDSGIGIPNEQLPKLFDRFYQVDDTATRAYEGTGIGLSLVKELTDLMEGTISVESEVGKGSIFKLSIPIAKVSSSTEPIQPMTKTDVRELPIGSPVILVVEDNAELRSFIVESLSKEAKVVEAGNGKDGWDLVLGRMPDVVVSDVMMPEMNGFELCQKAKTDTRTSHINFILLTAKTAQESKEKGLEAGADDYLTKPFHMYELELRIQNLLQQQANLRNHLRKEFLSLKSDENTPKIKNDFLRQLYEVLEGSMSNTNVSVDWLATEMAMSQSTLNRKLKSLLGLSAVEFIKQTRLKKSIELLDTGKSISNIAYQVGFESPSYFAQCFKEVYNLTPSDYQKETV
jgi:signal transduction histidine kinase/DNA-binding response OmpR family regulator